MYINFEGCLGLHMESDEVKRILSFFNRMPIFEKEDDTYIYEDYEDGFTIVCDENGFLRSVFLYAEGEEEAQEFKHDLPHELKFCDSRSTVIDRLGQPDKSGGDTTFLNKYIPPWDNYIFENYMVNIRYDKKVEKIIRVTLSRDV